MCLTASNTSLCTEASVPPTPAWPPSSLGGVGASELFVHILGSLFCPSSSSCIFWILSGRVEQGEKEILLGHLRGQTGNLSSFSFLPAKSISSAQSERGRKCFGMKRGRETVLLFERELPSTYGKSRNCAVRVLCLFIRVVATSRKKNRILAFLPPTWKFQVKLRDCLADSSDNWTGSFQMSMM